MAAVGITDHAQVKSYTLLLLFVHQTKLVIFSPSISIPVKFPLDLYKLMIDKKVYSFSENAELALETYLKARNL